MTYKSDSEVAYLVIHYSATPVERDYSSADIDEMHRKRGFREIGYHYFIRKDGTVETGRDLTQPGRFEVGAHAKGNNSISIGICYEGGVRAAAPNVGYDSRTRAQMVAMEALILSLLERFPDAVVRGHRDMPGAATQCPGFNATEWWDGVMKRRNSEIDVKPSPTPVSTLKPAPVYDCPEVMDLIDEADGEKSTTDLLNNVMEKVSGFGLTGGAIMGFMQEIDWRVAVAIVAAGALVYAVATYTRASRKRKADKAVRARMALQRGVA